MTSSSQDVRYMGAAVRLARRGVGRTWPNPSVGCVIVRPDGDDGKIVGRGWTMPGGRPHAEAVALKEAAVHARGATVYVTLEPCAHHGRAGPCADALIAAGVARVVCGMEDPDPRTAGQGFTRLEAAGIEVARGVAATQITRHHRAHILRIQKQRPFVQLKLAVSPDGYIAGEGRAPVRITQDATRGWVHKFRAQADAILVGAGTVRADDPMLTCRLPGAEARSPVRVVLDTALGIGPEAKLVNTAREVPTWIVCGDDASQEKEKSLAGAGVVIVRVSGNGQIGLPDTLKALSARGITRLMVEGGAAVAASFLAARLVDELWLFEGANTIGRGGYPAFAGGREKVLADAGLALAERFVVGQDHASRFERPE